MALRIRWKCRAILLYTGAVFLAAYLLGWLLGIYFQPDRLTSFSKEIRGSDGKMLHAYLSEDQKWRLETSDAEMPARLTDWLEWKEDKYFRYHLGFNPVSIARGLVLNVIENRRVSGASTITMQAVRLANQRPRTWKSKMEELFTAIWWELSFTKSEIFSFYVSHLPFGGNVEGFRAASRIYFGKEPNQLSLAQCAALVVIPNHPGKYHPLKNLDALVKKRNQFLNKLHSHGKITDEEWKYARLEALFPARHKAPSLAPHFCRYIKPLGGHIIQTTLDPRLQKSVEQLLGLHANRLKGMGVANASLLLADYRTGEIKCWIGNPDFTDWANGGEVDGVLAIRSPGSTLKPIIYGLALQKGMITPGTILYDTPQEFGTYFPENYDHTYRGPVPAGQALVQSLNIPAIRLLQQVGIDTFMSYTDRLGMHEMRRLTEKPGLSMAVGGCGTSLFELVQAYSALANDGKLVPLGAISKRKDQSVSGPILQPQTTRMIRHMLSVSQRGEAIMPMAHNPQKYADVAWKTGTSFGRKDAWCIGFGQKYVLGIWFGNFNGKGCAALSGVDMAAPVFQKLISVVESEIAHQQMSTPQMVGWKERKVCTATGLKPGVYCNQLVTDFYLPLVSSQQTCGHRVQIICNSNETTTYCQACMPAGPTKTKVVDNPPVALLGWHAENQPAQQLAPPHYGLCPVAGMGANRAISVRRLRRPCFRE